MSSSRESGEGHHDLVGQPHDVREEGPVAAAEATAAELSGSDKPLGDYVLIPRIIGSAVQVPALVTVVAVLLGGALLGVIGALVAISIAAALLLLAKEVLYPRLDHA